MKNEVMLELARERLKAKKEAEDEERKLGDQRVKDYVKQRVKGTAGPKMVVLGARGDIRRYSEKNDGLFAKACGKFADLIDYWYPVKAEDDEEEQVERDESKEDL